MRYGIIRSRLLGFACLAMLIVAPLSTAQAVPTTYTYTGNPYTEVMGSYTTAMSVTGTFALSSALGANLVNFSALPLVTAFSLSDGFQTFTQADAFPGATQLSFYTDGAGAVTGWFIEYGFSSQEAIATCNGPAGVGFGHCSDAAGPVLDVGINTQDDFGTVIGSPGVWSSAAAPEPSSHTGLFLQLRATSAAAITTAPPPSEIMQHSNRCSGSAITLELTTSSMVVSRMSRNSRSSMA